MGKIKRSKRESDSEYVVAYLISKDKGIISHNFFLNICSILRGGTEYTPPPKGTSL